MPEELQPQPQPAFYSLTPEPAPAPVPLYKKRHFGMIIGAVVIAMLLMAFVIVFAMNMIQAGQRARAVVAEKKATVEEMVKNGTPQSIAAREVGLADGCMGLTGAAYANCLSLIAYDAKSTAACAALEGTEKTACVDGALSAKAMSEGKYAGCAEITDLTLRAGCQAIVIAQARTDNDCAGHGVPVSECTASPGTLAVSAGDITACDQLPPAERDGCLDGFFSRDTDKDGLSDGEELTRYQTDPKNADTDGDGYTDGEEITSGHDPLKK